MNFQQLQYIIAINEHRHFVRAAEVCGDVCIFIYDRIKSMMGITRTGISNILFRKIILSNYKYYYFIIFMG